LINLTNSQVKQCFFALKDFFVPNLSQRFSSQLYRLTDYLFRIFFDSFPFNSFSAYSSRQQASPDAEGVSTVRNVAHFFGPSAPYSVAAVEGRVFGAFEKLTGGRTSFCLSQ
jgi:hypothetical protein